MTSLNVWRSWSRAGAVFTLLLAVASVGAVGQAGCAGSRRMQRANREDLQKSLSTLEKPGLVVGEFPLSRVLDGDTVQVAGLDSSLRLLGIDTEEIFHNEHERREFEVPWEEYLKNKRGKSAHPVKMSTPMGEEAREFAIKFFDGSPRVRLERDHPKEIRDVYGRYLAYVFAFKDGAWVNYNVECVRAGMSPYFSKYGYSRRFHAQFVAAEKEARAAGRGVWSAEGKHYPDYPERKVWWDARADFILRALDVGEGHPDFVVMTHWDALWRLERLEGKEVTILGAVSKIRLGDRGPSTVTITRSRGNDFTLVFFDKDVLAATQLDLYRGDYITARGVVTRYRGKGGGPGTLQMVIKQPGQVVGRKVDGLREPDPDTAALDEDAPAEAAPSSSP